MSLSRLSRALRIGCLPVLRSVAQQQQQQYQLVQQLRLVTNCSSLLSNTLQQNHEDSLFVGAYTPVTRQLWQDRLKLAQQRPDAAAGAAAQDVAAPRPPKQTVIKYPFTSDKVLLELVGFAVHWSTTVCLRSRMPSECVPVAAGSPCKAAVFLPPPPHRHLSLLCVSAAVSQSLGLPPDRPFAGRSGLIGRQHSLPALVRRALVGGINIAQSSM